MEVAGLALAVTGLGLALKGAVETIAFVEQIFSSDVSLESKRLLYQHTHEKFQDWCKKHQATESDSGLCILDFLPRRKHRLVMDTVRRVTQVLGFIEQSRLLPLETKPCSINGAHTTTNRMSFQQHIQWVSGKRFKIVESVDELSKLLDVLVEQSEPVSKLQLESWKNELGKLRRFPQHASYLNFKSEIVENTCDWIFELPEYRVWLNRGESSAPARTSKGEAANFLWIKANAGMGKTFICTAIIDRLEMMCETHARCGLAYFYCDYKEDLSHYLAEILGNFVAQLSLQSQRYRHHVLEHLRAMGRSHLIHEAAPQLGYAQLKNLLLNAIDTGLGQNKPFETLYLIIDAIDEFRDSATGQYNTKEEVMRYMITLSRHTGNRIKVLVTGRPTTLVQRLLFQRPEVAVIEVNEAANHESIKRYIHSELRRRMQEALPRLANKLDGSVQLYVVDTIARKAEGMFLFARLHLTLLFGADPDLKDMETILKTIPPNLNATWKQLLEYVEKDLTEDDQLILEDILKLLVGSVRTMTIHEIQAAIATARSRGVLSRSALNEFRQTKTLIRLCGPLVKFREATQEIFLAHYSLKEFLQANQPERSRNPSPGPWRITNNDAHSLLAKISLTYLSSDHFTQPCSTSFEMDQKMRQFPFLNYAVFNGGEHLEKLSSDYKGVTELLGLLDGIFFPETTWTDIDSKDEIDRGMIAETVVSIDDETFPYYQIDIRMSHDSAPRLESYPGPSGSSRGPDTLFLDSNIDNENRGEPHGLLWALKDPVPNTVVLQVREVLEEMVIGSRNAKFWLQAFKVGATPGRKDHPLNITPIYYASFFGWAKGVSDLIRRADQRRVTDSDLNLALRAAAMGGHNEVISLLIDAGANVNQDMGPLGSPLQTAAYAGKEETVSLLIHKRAAIEGDVFRRAGGTVGSAFQGAALSGNIAMVDLLVKHGADINSNHGWLGTALQAVLERTMWDMGSHLIAHEKFEPNCTGGYYGSAPRFLCLRSNGDLKEHEKLLHSLFDGNSDPKERAGPYGSLLELTAHTGQYQKFQLILDRIDSIDSRPGVFGHAIHASAMSGSEKILDRLMKEHNGSRIPSTDPNLKGIWLGDTHDSFFTDQFPAHFGDVLILREGEGWMETHVIHACRSFYAPSLRNAIHLRLDNHNSMFALFREEPTHEHGHFGNALQGAAFLGMNGSIDKLISGGADVNAKGGFFGTALQAAASQNRADTVELLLRNGAHANTVSPSHYGTALAAATFLGFDRVAVTLNDNGAVETVEDEHGWSPLAWACLHGGQGLGNAICPQRPLKVMKPSVWNRENGSSTSIVDNDKIDFVWRDQRRPAQESHSSRKMRTRSYINPLISEYLKSNVLGATVLANHPAPPDTDFYYEVNIITAEGVPLISIGMCEKDIPHYSLPGFWHPYDAYIGEGRSKFADSYEESFHWPRGQSYGYRGDDGSSYVRGERRSHHQWPIVGVGDRIGCGISWSQQQIFFTHNGSKLDPGIEIGPSRLYPAVGVSAEAQGVSVQGNFELAPFHQRPNNRLEEA